MFNGFFCRDFGSLKWTYNSLLIDFNYIYIIIYIYTPVNMNVNVRLSDLHLGTTYVSFLSWQHPFDTSEFGYVQTQFRNDCQVDGHCFVSSQFACSRVQVKQVPTYRACSQGKHSFIWVCPLIYTRGCFFVQKNNVLGHQNNGFPVMLPSTSGMFITVLTPLNLGVLFGLLMKIATGSFPFQLSTSMTL
jgi:hypothetical protein